MPQRWRIITGDGDHSKAAYARHNMTTAISQISLVIYSFSESLNLTVHKARICKDAYDCHIYINFGNRYLDKKVPSILTGYAPSLEIFLSLRLFLM